jgi:1-hydroxycarotenoid 3,4-desaturase
MVSGGRIIVIGAGVAGLVATLGLAQRGFAVTLVERSDAPGGKMRTETVNGQPIDAGPTVLTMRWVLEHIFREAGARLEDHLTLEPLTTLARHVWPDGSRLDLFADEARTADAIGAFSGAAEARAYKAFSARARHVYETLEEPFIRSSQPTPVSLALGAGLSGLPGLARISPFVTLWKALGEHFKDYRLRQLFARYATYCGSSPFLAPATLMLIAHVEQSGVWKVAGGMHQIARTLAGLATARGATIRYAADVTEILVERGRAAGIMLAGGERIAADHVVFAGDVAGLADGRYGRALTRVAPARPVASRSLSAVTWCAVAKPSGFPLVHHNVFFSRDYENEFREIMSLGRLPEDPTVYLCAEDRGDADTATEHRAERLLLLVNAAASGDSGRPAQSEISACERRVLSKLESCGLRLESMARTATGPAEFDRRYPASGGALYGQATHGWASSFSRPHARTKLPGLYLAGGGVHPGPGVPMAAISGWLAKESLVADLDSRSRSRPVVMPGGTSMR